MNASVTTIAALLSAYLKRYPAETDDFTILQAQLANHETLNDRHNYHGHVTGDAIVLSPDLDKILLIHHKFFRRWQQPGGHWDPDEADPLAAAEREAVEETGVRIARYLPIDAAQPLLPLQIITHDIPANPAKDEPAHYHHDCRYVFVAETETVQHQPEEVFAAQWFGFDAPESQPVAVCIARLRELGIIT